MFSLFGAIEFQDVAAQSWSATVKSTASGTEYFNSVNMPMTFEVKITYTSIQSGGGLNEVVIKVPTGYVLDNIGNQPSPPSGWTLASIVWQEIKYTRPTGVTGSSNITFNVKLSAAPGTDTSSIGDAWTITPNIGAGPGLAALSRNTFVDNTPPKYKVIYDITPKINVNPAILGLGSVTIRVEADEQLVEKPTIGVKQIGLALSSVTSTGTIPGNVFTRTYTISSTNGQNDGLAQVTVSGKDRAGNIGTEIDTTITTTNDGKNFRVDSQCDKPTLITPSNGASISSNNVTFNWGAINDLAQPVTYTLQYSTTSTFTTATTQTRNTNSVTYPATGLTAGTWYWKVKAIDALGNDSGYTTTRSFTVSLPSDVPTFRVRYIKTPKIDYNTTPDVVGAGSMQIRIYSSEVLKTKPTVQVKLHNQTTWTTLSISESAPASVFTATYNVPTASTNNGLAQITISGESMSGNVGTLIKDANWSTDRNSFPCVPTELDSDGAFFYVDTATDSPSLFKPDNGYVIPNNRNEANFTFYKISDISAERPADECQNNCLTYHIQYSTSPTFSTNVVTQSVDIDEANVSMPYFCEPGQNIETYNQWDLNWSGKPFSNLRRHRSQALSNGIWYWRVWATDKLGNQSPYSETRSFYVSTTVPNLTSPSDLSLLDYNNPILNWENVSSATFYNIRLSRTDSPDSTPIFYDYTAYPDKIAVNNYTGDYNSDTVRKTEYNVSTSKPPTPPIGRLEDGIWFWKVASSLDTTVYSETWRFTIDTTGPPAPNLLTLTNGQVSQNKRPTFTWTAVSDTNNLSNPVRYYIQISGNASFPDSDTTKVGWQPTLTWPSTSNFSQWTDRTYQRGPLTTLNFVPSQDFPETLLLDPSATYYWRVYAVDSAGNIGTNSLTRNFRVSTSPILVWGDNPVGEDEECDKPWPSGCNNVSKNNGKDIDQLALGLRSPSNGFTTNTRNPALEWRHSRCECVVKQISSYIIEYSTDITFPPDKTTDVSGVFQVLGINPDNINLINMGYTVQTPLYNGTYFWRVCAVDSAGNRTQFTAPWSFTVNVPDNEGPGMTPQCSSTVPCPSGFTCQNGACVAVTYSAGNLTLTVQNAGGTAISGATVTVDDVAQTTDAAGQVTFAALTGGSHTLNNVTASGYNDYGTSTILVNGNTTQTITMTVPGTEGYIWGTIYFDTIGAAAPNVLIDIYNQSTDVKVDSRLTNSEGRFQSSPLPSTGTYYAKIPAYEKELRDLQPTSLTTGEKIVILETKGTVTGIVQDDGGQIVSSATVVLKKYPGEEFVDTKTTNTIGQFSFDALPGTYVVTISKAGYDAYTSSSFSVQSKQTVNLQTVLGNIVLNAIRGTLTVSVKDDKGATINTATVTIRSSTGAVVRSITTSGGTGSTQLAPGAYRVSAVSSGFAESLQQTTNITSNQTSSVSITLAPATGSIRVAAKDASGAPLAGASVYVDGSLSGITDSEGELLITGLKLGTHTVRITKGGFTTVEEQVTAGESTVIVDTALRKNNLPLYLGIGLGLLILAGALYYFKFRKQGPKRPTMPKGPALPGRPGAPKLRPHRHKGGLPPSSIKIKKKNL